MPVPSSPSGKPSTNQVREVLATQTFSLARPGTQNNGGSEPSPNPTQAAAAAAAAPPPAAHRPRPNVSLPDEEVVPVAQQTPLPSSATSQTNPVEAAVNAGLNTGRRTDGSEVDADIDSVDLPSQGQFYNFGPLEVKPIKGKTIAKFHRAYTEQRLRYTVEAISSTLVGVSAFDLVPADFYYLLYWHKTRNIGSSQSLVQGTCTNPAHVHQVKAGEKSVVSLKIEQILTRTTLDVIDLPIKTNLIRKYQEALPNYVLGVETMADVVAASEYVQELVERATTDLGVDLAKDESAEFIWAAERAGYVVPQGDDKSFQAKIQIIEEMDAEDLKILDLYIAEVSSGYGVSEYGNLRCKECGALTKVRLSFDALTFLPSAG